MPPSRRSTFQNKGPATVCLFALWMLCAGVARAQVVREETTLQALLQAGLSQFEEQNYAAAAASFDRLRAVFGAEPEYQATATQQVVLPIHGYAKLAVGETAEAIPLLEEYLRRFPGRSRREALGLFALGQSYQAEGKWESARTAFERFAATYADTPEAGVARLRIGESYVSEGKIDEALAAFDSFFASRFAFSLRLQARLRSLQLALEHTRWEVAVGYLLETPWEVESMPELALLSFAALQVGDFLLAEERFDEAVEAYRLVPSYRTLLLRQTRRLEETRALVASRSSFLADRAAGVWAEHYRNLIARLEALLTELENTADYTGGHLLRYGQAFSGGGRHYEAWVVLATAAEDPNLPTALRREAHYRWILEAQALERWSAALEIATVYVERYPDAPRAPVVLFLLANAHQQLGDSRAAVAILDRLVRDYPEHRLWSRWIFSRGFNKILLGEYPAARADLGLYAQRFASGALIVNARLWHALAWFFEKQYEPALEELDALVAGTPPDHHLAPEMAYRRGAVLYAKREYDRALAQLEAYLASYPEDRNVAEASVILGDTLMGLGRLKEAIEAFAVVGPPARHLFPYAVFQVGKIYRALVEYDAMAEYFSGYVARTDLQPHPRRSEALYWVGWARERQGREAEAVPVFLNALERFANDPAETEIGAILGSLHLLHQKLRERLDPAAIDRRDVFLASPRFLDWLGVAGEQAWAAERLTAFSRYRLYEIDRRAAEGQRERAREMRLELAREVPREALDAPGLVELGRALREAGHPAAPAYFEDLLRRYPNSPQRISAWLGLGEQAFARGDWARAEAWLRPAATSLPTHPDASEASLVLLETLLNAGRYAEMEPVANDLLRLRAARGRPHARCLLLLARAAEAAGDTGRAIPIYQRVYNLYRAYPDLVTPAYVSSAELFEDRGDLAAARDTWREILFFEGLTDPAVRERAEVEYARLQRLAPEISEPENVVAEEARPS